MLIPGFEPVLGGIAPLMLFWPLAVAAGIYALLRWVIIAPGGRATADSVSEHALWIGVMGWLGSSLHAAVHAGIVPGPASASHTPSSTSGILTVLAWPVLAVLVIHALGQFTYPQPRRTRRLAPLTVRRIADFLPKRLALVTALIFVAAALAIGAVALQPAYEAIAPDVVPAQPLPPPPGSYTLDQSQPPLYGSSGRDGRIAGVLLAACLGAALLVLSLGTWAVLALIARRRQLETLDQTDNALLRTIAMNRLLRTVATVAGGLIAIAGNYVTLPDPALPPPSVSINYLVLVSWVILLVMWAWRPPRLSSLAVSRADRSLPVSGKAAQPVTRLVVSLGAALPVAAVGTALLLLVLPFGMILVMQPAILVAVMTGAILLTIAAGELLLQRNYGRPGAGKAMPRRPLSPALLTLAAAAAAVFLIALAAAVRGDFTAGGILYGPEYGWAGPAVAAVVIVALAVVPLLLIRHRRNCGGDVSGLDTALRGISLYRLVRTVSAFLLAQAGLLLISESYAWRWVFGLGNPLAPADAYQQWGPAVLAGALLCAAAVVVVVTPVRFFVPDVTGVPDVPEVRGSRAAAADVAEHR